MTDVPVFAEKRLADQYGPAVGLFEGSTPVLLVSDPRVNFSFARSSGVMPVFVESACRVRENQIKLELHRIVTESAAKRLIEDSLRASVRRSCCCHPGTWLLRLQAPVIDSHAKEVEMMEETIS